MSYTPSAENHVTDLSYLPSTRASAITAIICFVPVVIILFAAPDLWWRDYPGLFFHLALFLLIPRLPGPAWGKAAGYGWLFIDVTVGIMTLNGVPVEIAAPMRLGGHVFAGLWLITASLHGSLPIKITGVIAGVWMFGFSFVSPYLPARVLAPASILIVVWLVVIVGQNGISRAR